MLGDIPQPAMHDGTKLVYDSSIHNFEFNTKQKWYTSDIKAKKIQDLLMLYSDALTVNKLSEKIPYIDPWIPLLQEDSCILGTGLGRMLIHAPKMIGVERFLTVARLSQGIYDKNMLLKKEKPISKIICKNYYEIHAYNDFKYEPKNAIFADWDYTALGSGWLWTKKHFEKDVLHKDGIFYPQQIRVWVRLVISNNIEYIPWTASIAKSPKNLTYGSDKSWLPIISCPDEGTIPVKISTKNTIVGIEYGYEIILPHGNFVVCDDHAFQPVDTMQHTLGETYDLSYKITYGAIKFGSYRFKATIPCIKEELWKRYLDPATDAVYDEAIAKIDGDGTVLDGRIMSDTPVSKLLTSENSNNKVDHLVIDCFDSGLIGNAVLNILPTLRTNLLKTGGHFMPYRAKVYAQLVEYRNNVDSYGNDLSLTNPYRWNMEYQVLDNQVLDNQVLDNQVLDIKKLSDEIFLTVIDFDEISKNPEGQNKKHQEPFGIPIIKEGVCSAITFWFKLYLDQGDHVVLDSRQHHWKTALQYLPEYIVKEGDNITLQWKFDEQGFQFGIVPDCNLEAIQTPRFDPQHVKNTAALQEQMKEIFGRFKYQPQEKKDIFEHICKMGASPGCFSILPQIINNFCMLMLSDQPEENNN